MRIRLSTFALAAAMCAGCAVTPADPITAPMLDLVTATLPPAPAANAVPPTADPTPTLPAPPIAGTTTTQLNVRAEPLSSSRIIGVIPAGAPVRILSREPSGNWYRIEHTAGESGAGWVAAQYVTTADVLSIPLIGKAGTEPTAVVREQIFVRGGPGTDHETFGTLAAKDVVFLLGRDAGGAWIQIGFTPAPGGKGWVAASFLDGLQTDGLPLVNEAGQAIGTVTPKAAAPTLAPPVVEAPDDGDSASAPAVDVVFSPAGAGSVFYSDRLSVPTGDSSDWIRVTPYLSRLTIVLRCSGAGTLRVQFREARGGTEPLSEFVCGDTSSFEVVAGTAYTIRLEALGGQQALQDVSYTLSLYGSAAR